MKREQNEAMAEQLAGELLLFGLLGKLFYETPEQADLQQLVDDEIFAESPFAASHAAVQQGLALLQDWAREFEADAQEATLDVKTDNTRLFSGALKLPLSPWESVYYSEERLLFQESTIDVRNWYQRFGLEPVKLRREPDDHIGLELAFIAHLAQRALVALEQGDDLALEDALDAQREFCRRHLFAWAPLWCAQMIEYARTSYYRGLAHLLRGALDELAIALDMPLPEVAQPAPAAARGAAWAA